jgi:hypothetical protein
MNQKLFNWINIHIKPCPKCHKPVGKNSGCNLVIVTAEIF